MLKKPASCSFRREAETERCWLLLTPWCRWPDSNRHALRHLILSQARLPIPSHRQIRLFDYTTAGRTFQVQISRGGTNVAFIIKCERANKLRRTYFFTQKRRRGYEIRVLKARGAADYRGNVRKGRKAGRDCRACRQVPSDHIPRARARQDRGNGLPLSSRV